MRKIKLITVILSVVLGLTISGTMVFAQAAPYLIRGHPDAVSTKVGNHFKDWIPVFSGKHWIRTGVYPDDPLPTAKERMRDERSRDSAARNRGRYDSLFENR